jgi:hypothetical protein
LLAKPINTKFSLATLRVALARGIFELLAASP